LKQETILCIETAVLRERAEPLGFVPAGQIDPEGFLRDENLWLAPRPVVEYREDFRQIIPYVILRHEDSVAIYRRTAAGGETRLHGLFSIGFGGHIRLSDIVARGDSIDVKATLSGAASREVDEEVFHSALERRDLIGIIYDDADAVSRVHLGVVELWSLKEARLEPAEDSICECRFVRLDELGSYSKQMEGWSRLCAVFLAGGGFAWPGD
jgi:predicted NUDIX family phosphoesterase